MVENIHCFFEFMFPVAKIMSILAYLCDCLLYIKKDLDRLNESWRVIADSKGSLDASFRIVNVIPFHKSGYFLEHLAHCEWIGSKFPSNFPLLEATFPICFVVIYQASYYVGKSQIRSNLFFNIPNKIVLLNWIKFFVISSEGQVYQTLAVQDGLVSLEIKLFPASGIGKPPDESALLRILIIFSGLKCFNSSTTSQLLQKLDDELLIFRN